MTTTRSPESALQKIHRWILRRRSMPCLPSLIGEYFCIVILVQEAQVGAEKSFIAFT